MLSNCRLADFGNKDRCLARGLFGGFSVPSGITRDFLLLMGEPGEAAVVGVAEDIGSGEPVLEPNCEVFKPNFGGP